MKALKQLKRATIASGQLWKARKLPVELEGFTVDKPVFFIGGSGRSGTTLLRVMLNAHPEIWAGPELNAHANILFRLAQYPRLPKLAFRLYAPMTVTRIAEKYELPKAEVRTIRGASSCLPDFMDRLMTRCAERAGKPHWLEKSPANVRYLSFLFRNFPKSRFVHVIRDGRDAICSLRKYRSFVYRDGERIPSHIENSLAKAVKLWTEDVESGLRFRGHPQYLEIRYRDLVIDTEMTLRKVCGHLDVNFSSSILEHHKHAKESGSDFITSSAGAVRPPNTKSMGRWKTDLTHEDAVFVQEKAGHLLQKLGYIEGEDWTNLCK